MSSKVKFFCDFCNSQINPNATTQGEFGACKNRRGEWVTNLKASLDGPHICKECISGINTMVAIKKTK